MGGKKRADPSLKGKKPSNKAKIKRPTTSSSSSSTTLPPMMRNPSHISNKLKRSEMYGKYLEQKRKRKDEARKQRREQEEKEAAQQQQQPGLGDENENDNSINAGTSFRKQTPNTLDNTREVEPTMVTADDIEVIQDEMEDEFVSYFSGEQQPKILITTRPRPSQNLFYFVADLQQLIPNLEFYPRKSYSVKEICQFAQNRNYTHVMILSEKNKQCNGLTISHVASSSSTTTSSSDDDNNLPDDDDDELDEDNDNSHNNDNKGKNSHNGHFSSGIGGPTAFFKVSNVVTSKRIPNRGRSTNHIPELNLHGFGTRLGHRIGRLLGSLFPHNAEFQGRQVVTFHNQRDYLFVRHHRYIFDEVTDTKRIETMKQHDKTNPMPNINTRLQELGPRFTLKLRWLQEGIFDTQFGEYEWIHKRKEMDVTRRKFHL